MAKYRYLCGDCNETQIAFHKTGVKPEPCRKCGSENIVRILSQFFKKEDAAIPIGYHTRQGIEENKQELERYKKELRLTEDD